MKGKLRPRSNIRISENVDKKAIKMLFPRCEEVRYMKGNLGRIEEFTRKAIKKTKSRGS